MDYNEVPVPMKTTLLASLAFLLTALSNVRADDPKDSKKEVRGRLEFKSRRAFDGIDIGQEGNALRYITGDPDSPQRAIWSFENIPKGMMTASGDFVAAKFKCSHFSLVKQALPGAQILVRVVSHTCPQQPPDVRQKGEWQWVGKKILLDQYQDDVASYRAKKIDPEKPNEEGWKAANALAEKYGYYETRLPIVFDQVETDIAIPTGLFRNALKHDPEVGTDGKPKRPLVSIYVKCETCGLLLGMMETDLHLVEKLAVGK